MRRDQTFAQIFLILSVANVALAAPAVVRQRHLDVAEAASEKRGQGQSLPTGSTIELPPAPAPGLGSIRMPPHEHYADMWGWVNNNQLTPPSPGGTGSVPESSSAAANRITATQAPPRTANQNRITTLSPESSFHSSVNWPDPVPPPHLLAPPEGIISRFGELGYLKLVGILGAGVAFGYGLNKGIKKMYVYPLSPLSPADI